MDKESLFNRKLRFWRQEQLVNSTITVSIDSKASQPESKWAWLLYVWIKSQNSLSWEGSLEQAGPASDPKQNQLGSAQGLGPWPAEF